MAIDLNKSADNFRVSLTKKGIRQDVKAEFAFDLDVSYSYRRAHEDGTTNELLRRLTPLAMVLDPDKQLDVFTFSSGSDNAVHVGTVTPETVEGYIKRHVIGRKGWGGGTDYSFVLEANLRKFGWLPEEQKRKGLGGFFGKAKTDQVAKERRNSVVLFVTDGENTDRDRTEQVLAQSEERKDGVYFLFIANGPGEESFPFLKEIGKRFSNTGLVVITDLKQWVARSDDEIYNELLGEELVTWLKKS